ncbi:HD-GYP domain-containing protein [Marinicrinis sediminis]|uniref:HD-GYP domain-containing protein n=1 Tax=Marinicrinis sediminis TaxID=1652465 RepID=A0ABW5R5T4_9BACL
MERIQRSLRDVAPLLVKDGIGFWLKKLQKHDPDSYQLAWSSVMLADKFLDHSGDETIDRELFLRSLLLRDIGKLWLNQDQMERQRNPSVFYEYVQHHPERSVQLLAQFNMLHLVDPDAILYHHENLDGTGYPFAVDWQDITFEARLMRIMDAFCRSVHDYPSVSGLTHALDELYMWSDVQYDKDLVQMFGEFVLIHKEELTQSMLKHCKLDALLV